MGGCASRPKDLDILDRPADEAQAAEMVESDTAPQENNGGEHEKTDEAVENLAEPKEKVKDSEEMKSTEGEEKGEAKVNEAAAEQGESTVEVQVEEKDEAKAEDSPAEVTSEVKAEDSPAKVAATPEPGKALEPVKEEAEPIKARDSDDKSDEPLVTM